MKSYSNDALVNAFLNGNEDLFIVLRKGANIQALVESDIIFEKSCDLELSFLLWKSLQNAENYISKRLHGFGTDEYKVEKVSGDMVRPLLQMIVNTKCITVNVDLMD